jgi:serine/threonine-protein phosphatase 2A activator
MYNAEVLSKFPVVQHFPFGSLFAWERDPNARAIQASVHTASQPKSSTVPSPTSSTSAYSSPRHQPPTRAPQQAQGPLRNPLADTGSAATAAPWARPNVPTHSAVGRSVPSGAGQPTREPWASRTPAPPPGGLGRGTSAPWAGSSAGAAVGEEGGTRAPWAVKKEG